MNKNIERNFKGVWIPKEIWLSTTLTLQEKVLLVEIDSLDQGKKGCYANNRYFADFFQLSQSRVSEVIGSLEKKGFLIIRRFSNGSQKEGRSISVNRVKAYTNNPSVSQNNPSESRTDPSGNAKDNNTLNNTKNIPLSGKPDRASSSTQKDDFNFTDQCRQVIDHLNKKASTSFRHVETHNKLIVARLRDGATVEEMKRVIDSKCNEWLSNEKMRQFLQPKTLFRATNYENYVGSLPTDYVPNSSSDADDYMMGI